MTLRIYCPSCSAEIRSDADICPTCGIELNPASQEEATRRLDTPTPRQKVTTFESIDDARFIPGAIIAERYRIVGLLGKGGMGEVYRADDLKLSQPVALKFLPDHLLSDGAALARFHREVRVARQVSHKNVCRVYDIGEVDGRHFLSMEFIKGEELSSFMRRIGRLPQDKAIQIARQICAGLAAAHDSGVLHRDLKPANVMIDADGNARITDFGLAGLAGEFGTDELAAGTPAYMAPEQLAGKEQTVKTDIYSLGLVLYEIFTSKKAFEADTFGDLIKLRRSNATPTTPTSHVKDLDPLIEKVIDRCIQTNPSARPASALEVAAALPGGDPIAAALAAGETPSPEMVAAAPKQGILRPKIAAALFGSFLVLLAASAWVTRYYSAIYHMTPLEQPPAALRTHARDVIKKLGYTQPPVDVADGIVLKKDYLQYIEANDPSPARWEKIRYGGLGPYRYWYRQSPRYFETFETIEVDKPALDVSGMASIYLDMQGRLHWFTAVPPQREPQAQPQQGMNAAPDWSLAFREAGLDMANFKPAESTSIPLHAYDARAAWDGPDPQYPELNTHVEAASFRGKLIYFETIYPWDQPLRQEQPPESRAMKALTFLLIAIYLVALFGSLMLARRNLRLGRGDRRGATRVALVYFAVRMLVWIFVEHHNGLLVREFDLFFFHLAKAVLTSAFLWLLYVALEPFIRRRWPGWIISWSRLLAGDFRDPLVGRDVLLGAVIGAAMMLILIVSHISPMAFGQPLGLLLTPGNELLGNLFFARFSEQVTAGLFQGFIAVFLLLLFVVVLRSERLAVSVLWLLITVIGILLSESTWMTIPFAGLWAFLTVFTLVRFGLLALVSVVFFSHLIVFYPVTTEITAWYAVDFTIALVIAIALAAYGFYISLGGQKLLPGTLLEE